MHAGAHVASIPRIYAQNSEQKNIHNNMTYVDLQDAPIVKGGDDSNLQHFGLTRPRRRKTHPANTIILVEGETVTHEPVTTEDLFTQPLERSHSEDLLGNRNKEAAEERQTINFTGPVNGIALPALQTGGVKSKSPKNGADKAGEKESVYQHGEPPTRPTEGSRKLRGSTCEGEYAYARDELKTTAPDRYVDYKGSKSSGAPSKDKRNGLKQAEETEKRRSVEKTQQKEKKVTSFNKKSLRTSTGVRSSEEEVSKEKKPINKKQGKKRSSRVTKIHELSDHGNEKALPNATSKNGVQDSKLEANVATEASREYALPLERSDDNAGIVVSNSKSSSEPKLAIPQAPERSKQEKAHSKATTSGPSVAEAKDQKKAHQSGSISAPTTSKKPMGKGKNLHKEPRKGMLSTDGEMHELSDHEGRNHFGSPESSFKAVNGVALVSNTQPEEQTSEESRKETPTSNSGASSAVEDDKTNASLSPLNSSKSNTATSQADHSISRLPSMPSSHKNGRRFHHLDSGAMLASKDDLDTLNEEKLRPKSEIIPDVKASNEYAVPLKGSKYNTSRSLPDIYENQSTVAPTYDKSVISTPIAPGRSKKNKSEKNLSTPNSMVHSELAISSGPIAETKRQENEGQQNTGDVNQTSPNHYNKVQGLQGHEDKIGGKSHRNLVKRSRRFFIPGLRASRSEETLPQPSDLGDPKPASRLLQPDHPSSRSRRSRSLWSKLTRLFNGEPMPTLDVLDPAEDEKLQGGNGLQNEPPTVKSEDADRTGSPNKCVEEVEKTVF
ncbi:hypothetical protein TcWFU_009008 [Taenia crassiceps]|uniref:Uncharacterized protein n=1 Tax=Taenia crassiceps TaxID=6207 RepID=A0ABR4Q7B9_9CEST